MSLINNKKILNLILLFSIVAIITAYIIQYVLGHQPCNLCLLERIPYLFSIIIINEKKNPFQNILYMNTKVFMDNYLLRVVIKVNSIFLCVCLPIDKLFDRNPLTNDDYINMN